MAISNICYCNLTDFLLFICQNVVIKKQLRTIYECRRQIGIGQLSKSRTILRRLQQSSAGGPIVDVESPCHVQAICLLFGYFSGYIFFVLSPIFRILFFILVRRPSEIMVIFFCQSKALYNYIRTKKEKDNIIKKKRNFYK